MNNQRINEDWLFKIYSREEISRWINGLKYSYLWKRPGFRDEGDYIVLTLDFSDKEELLNTLGFLGINPGTIQEAQVGVSEVKDFPEFEQPLHCKINDIPTFVWIENKKIDFTFSGSCRDYEVCENDYLNCLKLETIISKQNLTEKVNREIESNIGCITKSKYPEL